MKRLNAPNAFRFLTFSCHKRLPLFGNEKIKAVFVESLAYARQQHSVILTGWVLMPEHVHLLLRPQNPEADLSAFLKTLKSRVANSVLKRWRELDAPVLDRSEVRLVRVGVNPMRLLLCGHPAEDVESLDV